jgi:Leucine-rich repeat (LRR) protein
VYSNKLTGSIPASIGKLEKLEELWLYENQLTGSLPASIGNLTSLKEFYAYNNQLSGELPLSVIRMKCKGCAVYFSENTSFTLPQNMGELGDDITKLDLSGCGLTGNAILC